METQVQKINKVDIIEDKVDIVEKNQGNSEINALTLIDKAIEKDIDVDKFAKLVDIVKMLENEKAKRDFYEALSNFQGEVPTITKKSEVNMGYGKPHYNYASLGDIITEIQKPLQKCGLSYHWRVNNDDSFIEVTCILAHKSGYELSTSISAAKDATPGKSNVQAIASTITYLKRYTLISLLGIGTADPDDDAQATVNIDKKQEINDKDKIIEQIKNELKNCKDEDGVKRIWSKYQKYSSDKDILQVFTDWRKTQTNEKINKTNNIKIQKGDLENGDLQL
ncbi:MAG TPA: ERF family protein [Candidatus Pacearchaeota archaeon]|nr:ERF family protein [Candidatus Pacearchaeota archaeon]